MSKYVNVYLITIILLLVSACDSGGGFGRSLGLSADGDNNTGTTAPDAGVGTVTTFIDTDATDNSVIESAAVGTLTGLTAFVDELADGVTVTFSLLDDAGGLFVIDPSTGVVTVAGPLDFETATSHVVTVFAQESGGNTQEADFTITVTDNLAPVVTVGFPGVNSLVIGNNTAISGNATDPEGNGIASVIVSVNGVDFDAIVDAAGNWSVPSVPLSTGDNAITITATDVDGEVAVETVNVNSQITIFVTPGSAIADPDRDRILVVDSGTGGITVVDPTTGELNPFPVDFDNPLSGGAELDAIDDVLFVSENTPTGDNLLRIYLTDDRVSRLPVRVEPGIDQFVLDPDNNRLLALEPATPAVNAVDLDDFSTSPLSDNIGAGTGPDFVNPTRIAYEVGNQFIVYDEGLGALITVDYPAGDRAVLANLPAGITDPGLVRSIEVDAAGNRLLVVTPTAVFTVDLDTGTLGVLSGDDVVPPSAAIIGSGPALIDAMAISIDGNRALVSDGDGAIIAIDLATGNRTVIASNPSALRDSLRYTNIVVDVDPVTGTATTFLFSLLPGDDTLFIKDKTNSISSSVVIDQSTIQIDSTEFTVDIENNIAYFFNAYRNGIVALNLSSGQLAVISDNQSVGSGIDFGDPIALALDKARGRILYTDANDYSNPGIRAVDIATGERSVFLSRDDLSWPTAITIDSANDRVLVIDDEIDNLFVINLESREYVAIPARTNAYLALGFTVITVDSNSDLAYILSISNSMLTSVNIVSGETNIISTTDDNGPERSGGNPIGNGLGFVSPFAIAWDENNQRLLVADPAVRGFVLVDPNTGDRAISFH